MKVLFVLGSFPELSESFIINQIVSLIDLGIEVNIFSYNKGKDEANSSLLKKYGLVAKCIYLERGQSQFRRLISFGSFLFKKRKSIKLNHLLYLRFLYQYQNVLIKDDYDIVHCHYGTVGDRFSKDFQNTPFFKGSKRICTFHGWDLLPTKIEKLKIEYLQLLQYFDAFTYNTSYLGDIVASLDKNLKTFELPVGIHLNFLESQLNKHFEEKKIFKILFCGRLVKWKGCLQMLELGNVLKDLGYEKWQMDIIGDGPEFENMTHHIKKNNLQNHVFLLGKQAQSIVFDKMNNSDVFLLPGIYDESTGRAETQGLVVQEAQYFYLPVIISSAGGTKYGMVNNETGYIINYGDINGYAEKLVKLMHDRELLKAMGEKGHTFVINNFSTKILAKKLLMIYNEVLK